MSTSPVNLLLLQKDQSWDKEDWIVPLALALKDLTVQQAAWRPQGDNLTIWQYVNHIYYYNKMVLSKLQGNVPEQQADTNLETFGEPGEADDEQGWKNRVAQVTQVSHQLRQQIASYSDEDLSKPYASSKTSIGEQLAGWMLHDAYHSAQIVLLRKLQGCWR